MAAKSASPFHLMAKPSGAVCNLDCAYCFYLEKLNYYPENNRFQMSDEVLEAYVRGYIESQPVDEVHFAWQGGEPTLRGVPFFRRVVDLQRKHANGRKVRNALQTNGTLLDEEWGRFLAENEFLVGISVDGPRQLHDTWRVDRRQQPTFDAVMRGLEVLKQHRVEFNTLTVVNSRNAEDPLKVYRFLKKTGSRYLQFIPLVERLPDERAKNERLDFAPPSRDAAFDEANAPVTEWTVRPRQFGRFLTEIFDEWVRHDVGTVFVNHFDAALANWYGVPAGMCVHRETCGDALIVEHDGAVYSCDHFMYPEFKLGNVMTNALGDMVNAPEQRKFGRDKADALPKYCRECPVKFACHGECPKHRFLRTPDGEPGLNWLCAGLKDFFLHATPAMGAMVALLERGRPASDVMAMARAGRLGGATVR